MNAVESGTHTVRLTVPAKPEYIVLTRLALSAVCRLTSLQPEDVADLKLAVTEAATGLVRDNSVEQLSCEFVLAEDRLVLELEGPESQTLSAEELELGRAIIRATVDECEFGDGAVTLVKYLYEAEQ
ncbi:MAG: ATP-binding protein [Thermoleophilaceae bacterium]